MKKTILLSFIVLALFVVESFAGQATLFGPKTYLRTTGAPNAFVDSFAAAPGEGMLKITNGDENGGHRLDSVPIFLNGKQIVFANDLNQQKGSLEIPVNLKETNEIRLELRSAPGSFLTVEIIGTPLGNPPTISITAEPSVISMGETPDNAATLTWTSTDADSCVINHEVGNVPVNGSITVKPTETTAYAITAMNAAGQASATVTVEVIYPMPSVTISVSPETIRNGGSATLTWSTTYADSCSIEPGIGSAGLNGSIEVTPTETTMYTLMASGPGGTSMGTATVSVSADSITLTIISPTNGENITGKYVTVRGIIENPSGNETGIVLNKKYFAAIYGNEFVANDIELEQGMNAIHAVATDTGGESAQASISVNTETKGNYIHLEASPDTGISPFETMLDFETREIFYYPDPVLTYTGPGQAQILQSPEKDSYTVKITGEGIYTFTMTLMSYKHNRTFTDSIILTVIDKTRERAFLYKKWNAMANAMLGGDIEGGVSHFSMGTRENCRRRYMNYSSSSAQINLIFSDIIGLYH